MIPHRIHRDAEAEFWAAAAYYEARIPGLALEFIQEVERGIKAIKADPQRWRIRKHGARRYNLEQFPYYIAYVDMADHVWIVAVAHGRRRPGYWKARLRGE